MRSETEPRSRDGAEQAFLASNRNTCDNQVVVHFESDFYDVARFNPGACMLKGVEVGELGDTAGESVLHL